FLIAPALTEIYTLSLHDALPIWGIALALRARGGEHDVAMRVVDGEHAFGAGDPDFEAVHRAGPHHGQRPGDRGVVQAAVVESDEDRKSTRLNSSHRTISYAVFCL